MIAAWNAPRMDVDFAAGPIILWPPWFSWIFAVTKAGIGSPGQYKQKRRPEGRRFCIDGKVV
jgi:hypothetical protein